MTPSCTVARSKQTNVTKETRKQCQLLAVPNVTLKVIIIIIRINCYIEVVKKAEVSNQKTQTWLREVKPGGGKNVFAIVKFKNVGDDTDGIDIKEVVMKEEKVSEYVSNTSSSMKRSGDRAVEYIMSCVKDPTGLGKIINYQFFAPIDETNNNTALKEINYNPPF